MQSYDPTVANEPGMHSAEKTVGMNVGLAVGLNVGAAVGLNVGAAVGLNVGAAVGLNVGAAVGLNVGAAVGLIVGAAVGLNVGAAVGLNVGAAGQLDVVFAIAPVNVANGGILMVATAVPKNALLAIVKGWEAHANCTNARLVLPLNAFSPIKVTDAGIDIVCNADD